MKNNLINKIKAILPQLMPYYLTILGVGWILLYVYLRLIKERYSYKIEDIRPFIAEEHYIIFIGFVVLHMIILITTIFLLYKRKYPLKTTGIFYQSSQRLSKITDTIFWKPLEYIHDIIAPHIPGSARFYIYLESIWTKKKYGKGYFYTLILIFNILPKVLVACVFFIDLVFFLHIKYFIYSLSLLILPIIFNIFLKLLITFSDNNAPILKEYFSEIKYVGDISDNNMTSNPYAYEFYVKPEYADVINPEEEIRLLFQLEALNRYALKLREDISKISPYVTLIVSSIYLSGGLFRIYLLIL